MRSLGFAGILTVVLCFSATSQAAFMTDWSSTPTLSDGVDGSLTAGRDITPGVWVEADADYWYFRMDLRGAPTSLGNDYAGLYGFYIDAVAGGAGGGDIDYIPTSLSGIDYIVDTHFNNSGTGDWEATHFHYDWSGTGFSIDYTAVTFQATENGGKTLEWKIAREELGDEFYFWAATHDVGSSAPTYDLLPLSGPGQYVPEPATMGLLLIGSLIGLRRRRR